MTPGPTGSAERGHPRALFFGDSYFIGGGCSPDAKQGMAYLAGTRLGYRTTVRGGGGTGFVAANPEYDLPPYLGQIGDGALDLRNPRLVVIGGGSNDRGAAGRPGEEERPEGPPHRAATSTRARCWSWSGRSTRTAATTTASRSATRCAGSPRSWTCRSSTT